MYPVVLLKSLFSLRDFMIKQKKDVEKNDKNNNAGRKAGVLGWGVALLGVISK